MWYGEESTDSALRELAFGSSLCTSVTATFNQSALGLIVLICWISKLSWKIPRPTLGTHRSFHPAGLLSKLFREEFEPDSSCWSILAIPNVAVPLQLPEKRKKEWRCLRESGTKEFPRKTFKFSCAPLAAQVVTFALIMFWIFLQSELEGADLRLVCKLFFRKLTEWRNKRLYSGA